jgi:PKD repeat protein
VGVNPRAAGSVPRGRALHFSANGNLDYNGGSVLHSSAPYLIFWDPSGTGISSSSRALFSRYFTDVAADNGKGTNVYAVDRQFTDNFGGFANYKQVFGSGQVINDSQAFPSRDLVNCPDTASTYPHCLTDTQLQAEVTRLIGADSLPTGTGANAPIYFVVTPGDTNICAGGSVPVPCADNVFCAYHSSFALGGSGATVLYASIPMFFNGDSSAQDPKACQADGNSQVQEPNGDPADVAIKYLSHEDNETITDPTGSGWWNSTPGSPNEGNEDGDSCNDAFIPTLGGDAGSGTLYNQVINGHHYYIQSEWSNGDVNCEMQPTAGTITPSFAASNFAPTGTAFQFDPTASTSSRGFSSTSWDFGDGGTAFTVGSPATTSHNFTSNGAYTVKLTLVDVAGNLATISKIINVGPPPTAAFGFSPPAPIAHDTVNFNASASSDPNAGATITSYAWDFGDGSTGSGVTPTHAFRAAGSFTVTLKVTDTLGLSNTTSHVVTVTADELPTVGLLNKSAHPEAGLPVSFDGSSSHDADGSIASYAWSFGDGSAGVSGAKPQHTYSRAGTYTVTLTVTDSSGEIALSSRTVKVAAPKIASSFKHGVLRVTVDQAGTITVGSKHKTLSQAGTATFKIKLSRHQRTQLRARHVLKLKLKVKFAPQNARATTEKVTVRLKS